MCTCITRILSTIIGLARVRRGYICSCGLKYYIFFSTDTVRDHITSQRLQYCYSNFWQSNLHQLFLYKGGMLFWLLYKRLVRGRTGLVKRLHPFGKIWNRLANCFCVRRRPSELQCMRFGSNFFRPKCVVQYHQVQRTVTAT